MGKPEPPTNDERTPHSIEVPSLLWREWQAGRPRWGGNYERLADRIAELIALDTWARHEHGIGILEHLADERYSRHDAEDHDALTWEDIDRMLAPDADIEQFPDMHRKHERERHDATRDADD